MYRYSPGPEGLHSKPVLVLEHSIFRRPPPRPSILIRMGSPHLPIELTDGVIDFCHHDKRALRPLTHSSSAASHFHLFRTITKPWTAIHPSVHQNSEDRIVAQCREPSRSVRGYYTWRTPFTCSFISYIDARITNTIHGSATYTSPVVTCTGFRIHI